VHSSFFTLIFFKWCFFIATNSASVYQLCTDCFSVGLKVICGANSVSIIFISIKNSVFVITQKLCCGKD
jgi:hypothetical protein